MKKDHEQNYGQKPRILQEKTKKKQHFPQESPINTPSKNDQEIHFFTVSFVHKPIQTPSN